MALLIRFALAITLRGRGRHSVALLIGLASLAAEVDVLAEAAPSAEYQVKAVFLFNLAQFVEWPARAFSDPEAPLVIGVLGEDPFGAYLDETLRGESVHNRPLILQRYRRVSDVKVCHVLFVSSSETDRLEQILASLRGRSVLTVGDADEFIARGGMIRLVTEKNKIRIRINIEAVRAANLTISSKLLRLAQPES
jgi:YfiR/HmsC-like